MTAMVSSRGGVWHFEISQRMTAMVSSRGEGRHGASV